jgi:hypothetical protein
MRKWRWISRTLPKGVESVEKTSIGLESEWNREKKTEADLKSDRFGRNRCGKTWYKVRGLAGDSHM